ncbi:hypothetical protein RvY_00280 [Ramazzottius varieornatus]|uniref:Uncharacterized protein n=1 Tax=Ramazzottius varieornatus TaxID=947166 RepID=A0A1D1UC97_RAMVA|nr:hypothetical protein RvY_00280 [Ramazzottius varieornatus]
MAHYGRNYRILSLLIWTFCLNGFTDAALPPASRCDKIKVKFCQNVGYTLTKSYDDDFHYQHQKEAEQAINEFLPLVQSQCSRHLPLLLCSVHVPMCSPELEHIVPVCHEVCHSVRSSCEPLLKKFLHTWPANLNCSGLPEKDLCIPLRDAETVTDQFTHHTLPHMADLFTTTPRTRPSRKTPSTIPYSPQPVLSCPLSQIPIVTSSSTQTCVSLCDTEAHFTPFEKSLVEVITAVLTALGFTLNILTLLSFLITRCSRFAYPERPIVYIASSFVFFSLGYVVRLIGGREGSCSVDLRGNLHLAAHSHNLTNLCSFQFLLSFYFYNAACLWWVCMTASWFLTACKRWSSEALTEFAGRYYHVFAWGISAVLTAAVLLWKKVDADELSAMCSVGFTDTSSALAFVIIPSSCCLLLGGVLSVAGTISGIKIRNSITSCVTINGRLSTGPCEQSISAQSSNRNVSRSSTERIDRIIWKMSLFSLLFIVFLSVSIASNAVLYVKLVNSNREENVLGELSAVVYVRLLTPLLLCVLTSGWLFTRKTVESWRDCVKCWTSRCWRNREKDERERMLTKTERRTGTVAESTVVPLLTTSSPWTPPPSRMSGLPTPPNTVTDSGKWTHSLEGSEKV